MEEDEENSEEESDNDESNESEEDSDDSSEGDEEVERRTNVFDIFKTTVLHSGNSRKSKPLCEGNKKKSKQELNKILRERLKMMKYNKD